jgi:hypothetical protein
LESWQTFSSELAKLAMDTQNQSPLSRLPEHFLTQLFGRATTVQLGVHNR